MKNWMWVFCIPLLIGCNGSNDGRTTATSYGNLKECTDTQKANELKGSFFGGRINLSKCIGARVEGMRTEQELEYVLDTDEDGKQRGCRVSTRTSSRVVCKVAEANQEFCRWTYNNRDLLCVVDL